MNDTPPDPADDVYEETAGDDSAPPAQTPPQSKGGFKAGPFIVVAVLVTIFALIQVQRKTMNRDDRNEAKLREQAIANSAVGLTIQEVGKPQSPLIEIPWKPGMTVRDVLIEAQKAGQLTFEETGEDDAAMLTSISGTRNEGGSTDSYNWTFRVNDTMADKSFGIYELQKGDMVFWKFGPYE